MSQAKITLIGIENYLNPGSSVFDQMILPEGIDRQTLIDTILLRCQEFELLYSDPEFLTAAVNVWSRKNYWTFDKWIKLINTEYNPLYNKDYQEEWTDIHAGTFAKSGSGQNTGTTSNSDDHTRTDNLSQGINTTTTNNLTRTDDLTTTTDMTRTDNLTHGTNTTRTDNLASTNDVTLTHSEKAYNSGATFVETTKDVTDQDGSQTGTVTNVGTETNTGTQKDGGTVKNTGTETNTGTVGNTGTITNTGTERTAGTNSGSFSNSNSDSESGNDDYTNNHTYHGYGNIGVTSAQSLFRQELEVARWNMYQHIADLFATEFCIMVY